MISTPCPEPVVTMPPPSHIRTSSRFSCRAARMDDSVALETLEKTSFPGNAMSLRQIRRHIVNERAVFYVVIDRESRDLAGYCLILHHQNRGARIYSLAVSRRYRRHGAGSLLLKKTMAAARRKIPANIFLPTNIFLEVAAHNRAARKLYESAGFIFWKKQPDYYGKGRHALKLVRRL